MSRARKKRSPGTSKENRRVLEQINHHAAGADMGSEAVVISVGEGVEEEPIRTFGTTTAQLRKGGEWMLSCGIDTVAIEATGVYWVPAYEIWQEQGLKPVLVDSSSIHSLNGKKKSDFIDADWLQLLHTFGLLRPCQRAERSMIELRGYMRRRREVIEASSASIQHMHAALTLMNVRLDQAVSDITGLTGMRIIRAILKGTRDPMELAQMRDERLCENGTADCRSTHRPLPRRASVRSRSSGSSMGLPSATASSVRSADREGSRDAAEQVRPQEPTEIAPQRRQTAKERDPHQ